MDPSKYLKKKIKPFDPAKVDNVADALEALQGNSFQGRNLGQALEILMQMVTDSHCLRVLTLAGAMIPAGMEEIICQAIEKGVINVIVSTGANITHSIVNHFEPSTPHQSHYIHDHSDVSDEDLRTAKINRIYDTLLPESAFKLAEFQLLQLIQKEFATDQPHIWTPSKFFRFLGEHLEGRNFLHVAAQYRVPVFCGATSDSELGLNLLKYRKNHHIHLILDELEDIDIFANIIKSKDTHGTIILGGGVPRNWAQQVFPYLESIHSKGPQFQGYSYSVRFHTATEFDGGLSGCSIPESISWGKYSPDSQHVSVWVDSTIGFPLVMTALFQRLARAQDPEPKMK
ncbi:MAG: deoxyhypusine synthase family protein [Promethearchaeota archaeon]